MRLSGIIVGVALVASSATTAMAGSVFLFDFDGGAFKNTAHASGSITFADGLPINPGVGFYTVGVGVIELNVTVTGASSGNGVFTASDFGEVVFDTGEATLDLTTEVVGQSTPSNFSWGETGHGGANGDFNIFALGASAAPDGVLFFDLATNDGSGDEMALMSFRPELPVVPLPPSGALSLMGMTGLFVSRRRR